MAIAFRASSALATSTSGTLTPALPTGLAAGDYMLMHVSQGSTSTLPTPTGWNLGVATTGASATHKAHLFWKFAASGEAAPNFSGGATTNGMWGILSAFSGVPNRADPHNVEPIGSTASGTSMTSPALTTTVANAMVVWCWCQTDNGTTSTVTGMTAMYVGASYDSVVGLDANHCGGFLLNTSAGSAGTPTVASSSGSDYIVQRLALDPTPLPPTRLFLPF